MQLQQHNLTKLTHLGTSEWSCLSWDRDRGCSTCFWDLLLLHFWRPQPQLLSLIHFRLLTMNLRWGPTAGAPSLSPFFWSRAYLILQWIPTLSVGQNASWNVLRSFFSDSVELSQNPHCAIFCWSPWVGHWNERNKQTHENATPSCSQSGPCIWHEMIDSYKCNTTYLDIK